MYSFLLKGEGIKIVALSGFSLLNFAQSVYASLYARSSSSSALASVRSAVSKPSLNQL